MEPVLQGFGLSGSGAYATGGATSTGTNSQQGSLDESREVLDEYSAQFSWNDADWQVGQHWQGQSQSDSQDHREHAWSSSTTSGNFAAGNGSFSDSSGTSHSSRRFRS